MTTLINRVTTALFFTVILSISTFGQVENKELKTIVFIDDFDSNSVLEPNYFEYFNKIKEAKLLGNLNYKRLNIHFDISGPKSIRHIDLSHKPEFIVLILGTSATTINSANNTTGITPTDYKNEYVNFVKRIKPHGSTIIVVSPPPYPTKSKEEDKKIIDNINAVQDVAESSNYDKIYYIKLYKNILRNYQESNISPKQLATWITTLIKNDVKELNN